MSSQPLQPVEPVPRPLCPQHSQSDLPPGLRSAARPQVCQHTATQAVCPVGSLWPQPGAPCTPQPGALAREGSPTRSPASVLALPCRETSLLPRPALVPALGSYTQSLQSSSVGVLGPPLWGSTQKEHQETRVGGTQQASLWELGLAPGTDSLCGQVTVKRGPSRGGGGRGCRRRCRQLTPAMLRNPEAVSS